MIFGDFPNNSNCFARSFLHHSRRYPILRFRHSDALSSLAYALHLPPCNCIASPISFLALFLFLFSFATTIIYIAIYQAYWIIYRIGCCVHFDVVSMVFGYDNDIASLKSEMTMYCLNSFGRCVYSFHFTKISYGKPCYTQYTQYTQQLHICTG